MRKQVSLSQLFTQTNLESVVFNSKCLLFNILKSKIPIPLKNTQTLYYLDCKNALHFIFFHKL
ncbi:hypothetical protein B0X41_00320 [Helicobacter pylori]|uniref:Uncharacterized protein n=1 Tax=Helicobacter pylori TaxID=210 RepID=A0AB36KFI8_HELPX|nr:hypothetical protein B0X41_00320 [Helicobacter pylori]